MNFLKSIQCLTGGNRFLFCCLAWTSLWMTGRLSAAPVRIPSSDELINFAPDMALFLDENRDVTIGDLLNDDAAFRFEPAEQSIPSLGHTQSAVWVRVKITHTDSEKMPVYFSLRNARLSEVDWYLVSDGQVIDRRAEGVTRPPHPEIRGRYPLFFTHLPPGQVSKLYIRIYSDTSVWLPLSGAGTLGILNAESRSSLIEQSFLGFSIAMVIFAVLVSFSYPGSGFIRLSGITFFFLTYYLVFHGYPDWWFPNLPLWTHRQFLLIQAAGSYTCMMSLTRMFFRDRGLKRWLMLIMDYLYYICLASVFLLAVLPFSVGSRLAMMMTLITYAFGFVLSVRVYVKSRQMYDFCFCVAWLLISFTVLAFAVQIYYPKWVTIHPVYITRMLVPLMYLFFLAANLQRQRGLREERESLLQARQAAVRAQLDALRYQLNPHFLFNALNSIEALSLEESEKIPMVVGRLATFLRLRLKPSKDGLHPLEEEIKMLRAYLDIEKVRFEDHLDVAWDVSGNCAGLSVPEMVMQPVIENAVKYGMREESQLRIQVKIYRENHLLHLEIRNTGTLTESQSPDRAGNGIGLSNLKERLKHHYGRQSGFSLKQDGDWVVAKIQIPIQQAPHESYSMFDY